MSTPGWYPDPGGRPGHYRFWDGRVWSSTTSPQIPDETAPAGPGERPARPRRGRLALVVGGSAVLVLVLVVVGVLVLRPVPGPSTGPAVPPVPSTSDGGTPTDDPVPSSGPPSDAPTDDPGPTAPTGAPVADCPVGDPDARQDHPADSRVHGGGLSFPVQEGWLNPGRQADAFLWAYDVGETDRRVEQEWYASYAVGALSVADGFEDPRSAAELTMECTVASSLYRNVTSRTDVVSQETSVDGHRAWTIRSEIRADDDRTRFAGDTVQVTVVDLDSPEALAFFWGCAPLGDAGLTAQLDLAAAQLRVD